MSDWKQKVAAKREAKAGTKLQEKAQASANVGQKVNTGGWRSEGNAYLFKLEVNEPIVAYYLNKSGRAGLARTQICDEFDFEFHSMHPTGCPVYIRMVGNTDTKNMTKFDTKNKTGPQYVNSGKLDLSTGDLEELGLLIRDNWEFLSYMAKCAYEDDGFV